MNIPPFHSCVFSRVSGKASPPRGELPPETSRGFTLVELLAAIAIVSVLSTVLLASVQGVRKSAKNAMCVAHLGQLGKAAAAYSQDNDNRTLPPAYYNKLRDGGYLPKLTKAEMISRTGVWMCPCDEKDRTGIQEDKADHITSVSYGYNAQRIGLAPTYWELSKISLSNIEKPSQTLYLADATSYYMNKASANRNAAFRHGGKLNALFFDGHVATLTEPDSIADFYNEFL